MTPAITVTPAAKAKVEAVRAKSGHPDACLRIAIAGRRGAQFVYQLDLVAQKDAPPGDLVLGTPDLPVLVDGSSAPDLDGAVIDLDPSAIGGALRIDNPHEGWRDPVAARVQEVLDRQINPSVAAHGGYVELLPGVRPGRRHPAAGNRSRDQGSGAPGDAGDRHDRPRRRLKPVFSAGQKSVLA